MGNNLSITMVIIYIITLISFNNCINLVIICDNNYNNIAACMYIIRIIIRT